MAPPDRIVIASRGSQLALRQTELLAARMRAERPETKIEILTVSTRGDNDKQRSFAAFGAKGIFTTEVSREVLAGNADVALHSAKDLTAEVAPEAALICIPARADARDVVVGGNGDTGEERLGSLPSGARVGTSSMRRRVLLTELRPDLEVVEFRGNLDTRLRKVAAGEVDAAVLAAAGIERLGALVEADFGPLEATRWVPAPGQGALAVEALSERTDLAVLFGPLESPSAAAEVACERAFSRRLEGGCTVPLGCHAQSSKQGLLVTGMLGSPHTDQVLRDRISGPAIEAGALGSELAEAILAAGGAEILEDIKAEEIQRS
ncbi:MAG: hydroxymethylbilane synthase [Actinomycetota bacterium]